MKTSSLALNYAIGAALLGAGILFSATAHRTESTGSKPHSIFNQELHKRLDLLPEQERDWQALKDEEELLQKKTHDSRARLLDAADSEFAKINPDLVSLSNAADAMREQNYTARKDFRKHALMFYSGLSAEQQLVVINAIKEKLQNQDRFLEKKDSGTKSWKVNV